MAGVGKGRFEAVLLTLPHPVQRALAAWLEVQGAATGPLLTPIDRGQLAERQRDVQAHRPTSLGIEACVRGERVRSFRVTALATQPLIAGLSMIVVPTAATLKPERWVGKHFAFRSVHDHVQRRTRNGFRSVAVCQISLANNELRRRAKKKWRSGTRPGYPTATPSTTRLTPTRGAASPRVGHSGPQSGPWLRPA